MKKYYAILKDGSWSVEWVNSYISVMFPTSKTPWVSTTIIKENAIFYTEEELKYALPILKKRKMSYKVVEVDKIVEPKKR